mmetsp:Transcript_35579/g.68216  ORF Transcript_35579/g.68216 Transcript_35579/m.68216 type:complete len:424 (-) Transcript_35579:237-1508(-)|eukprot:CAMPEP_0114253200 /NCGR_PEP_ID=MMETSP0058-20121206/16258_1 /TAXON_ID=36894 /ORGANISM="Pyramimonas parkeae, CCMP726" /LENGTH=423 /DNA_ID=CAMNT_0001367215 /DNA_START=187 /DNA_END=1458 /DNA_ORIENTATION=-
MTLASWLTVAPGSHFPLQNIPFGVFRPRSPLDAPARVGVAIGEHVLDLAALAAEGLFAGNELRNSSCFSQSTLNDFMGLGRPAWVEARREVQRLLAAEESSLRDNHALRQKALFPMEDVQMLLPAAVGDYTDFYASKEHASNVGTMYRGAANALMENWKTMPIGYHGRASSVVPSGTPVARPRGQLRPCAEQAPVHEPCKNCDFELEMGILVGPGNELGRPVTIEEARNHIFGFVLMNDWSARDIQKYEYVPLGPFGAKNWATTISPWVVTLEALEAFKCEAPVQDLAPVPAYLQEQARHTYDIHLEVSITPENSSTKHTVCTSNYRYLYWTCTQMLAHHTVTGCNMRPGDLMGSGTISGPEPANYGSLLELSWGGSKDVHLDEGITRKFLHDGDTVSITGYAQGDGYRIGFGDCSGKLLPAL